MLAKSFQIHYSRDSNAVVGRVYPSHFLPLPEKNSGDGDGDAVAKFLGECVNGKKGEAASEISSISPGDLEFMKAFAHASDNTLSAMGQDLKKRIAMQVNFYESMSPTTMKAISIEGQSD